MNIINFCGTQWKVIYQLMDDDGETDFDTQVITINEKLTLHRQKLALVHELMHVWYDYIGVSDDEKLVSQAEHGILELIERFGGEVEISTFKK